MKLTNYIRDAFVRSAMADVPSVDYFEQATKVAQQDALDRLPSKVKALYADPALRDYLHLVNVRFPGGHWGWGGNQAAVYAMADFKLSAASDKKIAAISAEGESQKQRITGLQSKLKGAAYAVTTRKALVDMLPEFEKYLPADDAAACKTLPVIANLVADFAKAGWPKGVKASAKSR